MTGRKSLQKAFAKSFLKTLGLLALAPFPAQAQSVGECGGWQTDARNIAEPWEENTATFANGDVRVAVLDTIEPGAVPFHLMVLSPPYDELGARSCALVSLSAEGMGFPALTLRGLRADYDPAKGLVLTVEAAVWSEDMSETLPVQLRVGINQQTGVVTAGFE
jgi:hypothetical protein